MNRRTFLLTLAAGAGAGCQITVDDRRGQVPSLRVLTYNVHHGEGVDGKLDLPRIARVINDAAPDLVALQEVDRCAERTGKVDQPAEYARLTGLHSCYGAAMPFQGGEYGQLLLSRWPLQESRVVRLPGTAGREPRIAVTAVVDVPGLGPLRWTGLHLDASREDPDRYEQAGALSREFGWDGRPTLLAGDFNATPESRVMARLLQSQSTWEDTGVDRAAPTVPAESPRSRIDYVLAGPRGAWQVLDSEVRAEPAASDHRPLLVVLRKQKLVGNR